MAAQVNLVATQLVLDREHPNRLVFSPSRGLDPLLDLRLKGAQVPALDALVLIFSAKILFFARLSV